MNGYALGQLSTAFLTAATHEDPATRRRADRRAKQWSEAISAMASGEVTVGSRTPASGMPAWVTLDVMRGGFATGAATAALPLTAEEIALAQRVGVHASRRLIFGYYLTDAGLSELNELLDTGAYAVELPEDAALLTIAWLVRAGDRAGALELLDALAPFCDRLRFAPKRTAVAQAPSTHVFRQTSGEVRQALTSRREREQVETQREALAVWNPFADRVFLHALTLLDEHGISTRPTSDWISRATDIIDEYERLATIHTRCGKHRNPKSNLAILLATMRTLTEGRVPSPRELGLTTHVIRSMRAKRDVPGPLTHDELRAAQHAVAIAPSHAHLAKVAAERLKDLDPNQGLADPASFTGSVNEPEALRFGIPLGYPLPTGVGRVLFRAHAAPVDELVREGVVPSAEVLAALIPQISATVVASTFADPALARLSAANYRAFRRRRSLLLLNLETQVHISELPWVRATQPHAKAASDEASAVIEHVGALVLDSFPGVILPNPLIRELKHLTRTAGLDIPLVEELAADIFMGRFSDTFARAERVAAGLLSGSLYESYYRLEWTQDASSTEPARRVLRVRRRRPATTTVRTFDELCWSRAQSSPHEEWSVARNGMVIEQSQILTTHNLAALIVFGVQPTRSWSDLAESAIDHTSQLLALAERQRRPLRAVKDAAYAWRQAVFFLSMMSIDEAGRVVDSARTAHAESAAMRALLGDLRRVMAPGSRTDQPRIFYGWSTNRHWLVELLTLPRLGARAG